VTRAVPGIARVSPRADLLAQLVDEVIVLFARRAGIVEEHGIDADDARYAAASLRAADQISRGRTPRLRELRAPARKDTVVLVGFLVCVADDDAVDEVCHSGVE
jgi:hypothetical protein